MRRQEHLLLPPLFCLLLKESWRFAFLFDVFLRPVACFHLVNNGVSIGTIGLFSVSCIRYTQRATPMGVALYLLPFADYCSISWQPMLWECCYKCPN